MNTSEPKAATLLPIRTFASDISRVRGVEGEQKNPALEHATQSVEKVANHVPGPTIVTDAVKKEPEPIVRPTKKREMTKTPPPFHKLHKKKKTQEKINKVVSSQPVKREKDSLLAEKGNHFELSDDKSMSAGTVITDTKRKRFRFFPALIESIRGWFGSTKKEYFEKRTPVYSVSDTSARQDVVRSATSKTGRDAVVDHRVVVERLRNMERSGPSSSRIIDTSEDEVHPEWRHLTDKTGHEIHLLDDGHDEVTEEKSKAKEKEPEPIAQVASQAPEVFAEKVTEPKPEPAREKEPVTLEKTVVEATDTERPPAGSLIPDKARWRATVEDTNTLSLSIVAGIAVIVLVVVVGKFVHSQFFQDSIETTNTDVTQVLENIPKESISIPVDTTPLLLTEILEQKITTSNNSPVLFNISIDGTTSKTHLTPRATLNYLDVTLEAPFVRTIEYIAIGGHQSTAPLLVLDIENKDTALAGMLGWEPTMSADLAPLFGAPVVINVDSVDASFTDVTIAGNDARVLYDAAENEQIVYGFSEDILIIATNSTAFADMIGALRNN